MLITCYSFFLLVRRNLQFHLGVNFSGAGKTFLLRAYITRALGLGKSVVVVSPLAKAAQLLPLGQTCHSAFAFTCDSDPDSVQTKLTPHSEKGQRLINADIVVWDEVRA